MSNLGPYAARPYAKYVLCILLLIYVSNQWSRYLLNYLYAVSYSEDDDEADFISIAAATGITESQYGLLVGFGFSIFYAIMGLVMGRAADQYNRSTILFGGLFVWNSALSIMAMSNNFHQLLTSRILLGIGESFSAPASYSLIADYFPVEGRAEANGIYAFGVYVGGGLGSLSIAMAKAMGWRWTCFVVAVYGFALSVAVILTVKDPNSKKLPDCSSNSTNNNSRSCSSDNHRLNSTAAAAAAAAEFSVWQAFREIFRSRLICFMFAASAIRFMAGYAITSYLPVFYDQIFPSYNTIYSYLNAVIVAIGGAFSSFIGGRLADKWEAAGEAKARVYVPAVGALLGIPTIALCVLSNNFYLSMFGLFLDYLTAECWSGPAISVIQNALPPRVCGVGIATYTFLITMAGSGMSYVLGVIYEDMDSTSGIRPLLLYSVCGSYLICAVLFYIASAFLNEPGAGTPAEKRSLLIDASADTATEVDEATMDTALLPHHRGGRSRDEGGGYGGGGRGSSSWSRSSLCPLPDGTAFFDTPVTTAVIGVVGVVGHSMG